MKPRIISLFLVLAFFLAFSGIVSAGTMMSVQVKKGDVRATPAFLGKIVSTLEYGDRVEVLERKDAWMRIGPTTKSSSGWIHSSALTDKRITLQAGSKDAQVAASGGELALAGKGFNAEVEAEFKARNRDLDFSAIDRMQATDIPQERIAAFLKEGGLTDGSGDAR
ncbi:MAG: SH3 domain-containing protein [Syntrophorhabdaceae bacterium]|nr:SH3 domain-containing protein [Syntrophorhabdaceae bacterium]